MQNKFTAFAVLATTFIIIVLLMMLPSYQILVEPWGKVFDWFPVWVGCRAILAGIDPYAPETSQIIHLGVHKTMPGPGEYLHGFSHPAYTAFVLLPFIILPFTKSLLLWVSLQIPLFMVTMMLGLNVLRRQLSPKALILLLLLSSFGFRYPINVYTMGQLTNFILFCLILSAWLYQNGHPRWAAVAFSGAAIRPDLVIALTIPIFILLRNHAKRNEFLVSLIVMGIIFLLLPMAWLGFWPSLWLNSIFTYGQGNPFITWAPGLLPVWARAFLLIGLTIWYLTPVVRLFSARNVPVNFDTLPCQHLLISSTVLFALLVFPQTGSYNLTLVLVPAIIQLHYAQPKWLKGLILISLLTPWFYFWLGEGFARLIYLLIPGQFVIFQELVIKDMSSG